MQIKAAEIADIIRRQIEGYETTIDMSEVGTVIASLATAKIPYTTGQVISVDGGMLVPRF